MNWKTYSNVGVLPQSTTLNGWMGLHSLPVLLVRLGVQHVDVLGLDGASWIDSHDRNIIE